MEPGQDSLQQAAARPLTAPMMRRLTGVKNKLYNHTLSCDDALAKAACESSGAMMRRRTILFAGLIACNSELVRKDLLQTTGESLKV